MEDNRNDRPHDSRGGYQGHRDRNRNRFRHGGGGGGGHRGGAGGRRSQRPLLTSAINGAGFTLLALVLTHALQALPGTAMTEAHKSALAMGSLWLSLATGSFSASAVISYVAQRVPYAFVEWISDLLFLVGAVIIGWIGLQLGGLL